MGCNQSEQSLTVVSPESVVMGFIDVRYVVRPSHPLPVSESRSTERP